MKRIIALILCLCFSFTLCACGEKEEKVEKYGVDVNYYAKLGQIPEVEYKLGADVDKIIEALDKAEAEYAEENGHQHGTYNVFEEGERSLLVTSGTNYYFDTDNKAAGVSYIVNFDASYGFAPDTYSIEIKEALETLGLKSTLREADAEEVFYIPGAMNLSVMEYAFPKCNIVFVFQEDKLCATAIYE